jgi:Uncharacterised nucleotidyltransferase
MLRQSILNNVRRREAELLLFCARTVIDAETAARIKALLGEDIDWEYLFRVALRNTMVPLLYEGLNAVSPAAIPAPMLAQLRPHYQANAWRNLYLARELIALLIEFERHGIRAVPYKGVALAAYAYGKLALRQFGDLDILVRKQDFSKVSHVLDLLGYQNQLTIAEQESYLKYHYHFTFLRPADRVSLEIHWAFTGLCTPFQFEIKNLWERLEPISLMGTTIGSFCLEDHLLILCMHGAKDYWQRLLWVCDLAELIRTHQVDWERVLAQATKLGATRKLFLGLYLAHDLLGTALPMNIMQRIQTTAAMRTIALKVEEGFFSEVYNLRPVDKRAFHSIMRERTRDRVVYWSYCSRKALLPNETDRTFLPLPRLLSPFYLILRPFRLVRQHGLKPAKYWALFRR